MAGLVPDAPGQEESRESLAGAQSAAAIRKSIEAEAYNIHLGPVRFQTQVSLGVGLTDNVFRSEQSRREDLIFYPEASVKALWPVTQLNTLRASVVVGYERYLNNSGLNSSAPLIRPESELTFNIYAGDFRIKLHEKPSYQQSLFYNSVASADGRFYNFNDVGKFSRFDNLVGFNVDWDLHDLILSLGYDHENFLSRTARFDYLDRSSEFLSASAAFLIHKDTQVGVEAQGSLHDYSTETILNDHWLARVGPFVEVKLLPGITLRAGGGYETAQYDAAATGSDFQKYYAYGRITQTARLFTHSLAAGRENLLGDNANNLQNTFVRYSAAFPIVHNLELETHLSANFAKEYGGAFQESLNYYRAGLGVGYQFHKHARATLAYDYTKKDSDLTLRDYHQNFLTVAVAYLF